MRFATPLLSLPALAVAAFAAGYITTETPAAAQGAACRAIQNDAKRLACYDGALGPVPTPQAPTPADTAPTSKSSTAPPSPHEQATAGESRRERRDRDVRKPTPAAASVPPLPSVAHAAAPSADATSSMPIIVVSARVLPGRGATFVTDGGAVWVQNDVHQIRVPKVPFKASIRPGAIGSYFLVPDDISVAIRVRQRK